MMPFAMIVLDELGDGSPERPFADENQPVEAGFGEQTIVPAVGAESIGGLAARGASRRR
jgi:hypothetical protein